MKSAVDLETISWGFPFFSQIFKMAPTTTPLTLLYAPKSSCPLNRLEALHFASNIRRFANSIIIILSKAHSLLSCLLLLSVIWACLLKKIRFNRDNTKEIKESQATWRPKLRRREAGLIAQVTQRPRLSRRETGPIAQAAQRPKVSRSSIENLTKEASQTRLISNLGCRRADVLAFSRRCLIKDKLSTILEKKCMVGEKESRHTQI